MRHWRFKSYESEDGINQPQAWYEQQDIEVQAHVLAQVDAVGSMEDSPAEEFVPLPGRYSDLYEMPIGLPTPQGMRHIGLLGFWESEQEFIVLICCEVDQGDYTSLLEEALRLKRDMENGKGDVHDLFIEESASGFFQ